MPTGYYETHTRWRDAKGLMASMNWYMKEADLPTAVTDFGTLIATIGPLTECGLQAVRGPAANSSGTIAYGTPGPYANAEDKVMFMFEDELGGLHRYNLPGPVSTIFLADHYTIAPANVLVAAFIAAMTAGQVCGRSEITLTTFIGGWRRRRRNQRRFNGFTFDPTLTVPAL